MPEVFSDVLNLSLLLAAVIAFLGAMIQGYSGFGGGLIIVPLLAILFGPVPAVAISAVSLGLVSAMLAPSAIKLAYWPEVAPVCVACVIAIFFGLFFLVSADPVIIRRGMGIFVLSATVILMSGWTYSGTRNLFTSAATGTLSGSIMGGFGMPAAPFWVIYYLSAPVDAAIQRANIVNTSTISIVFLIIGLFLRDAYTEETIFRTIIISSVCIAGGRVGQYLFKIAPSTWFKKVNYGILLVTGITVLSV